MAKRIVFVVVIAALVGQGLVFAPAARSQDAAVVWPTAEWLTSTPEAQGMSSEELTAYMQTWTQEHFHIDSMVIVRNGTIVAEAYGPLTQPDDIRQMASVSKSVTSALVGVMLQEGLLDSIDQPAFDFFSDKTIANIDAKKQAVTVRDLLTMGSGIACNDMEVSGWELGTSDLMENSEDWLQFALDLPIANDPGSQWYYCNAAVHILSGIITELTGMSALDYAAEKLFAPLGITNYSWTSSPTGVTLGYSDLKLTPRDMAKFGYLYLNEGEWDGQQIIPADYARESLGTQIETPWGYPTTYGYLWWRVDNINLAFALGFGGKYIMVLPDQNMVVVVTSSMTDNIRVGLQAYPMFFATAMLSTSDQPLPENPEGVQALEAVAQAVHSPAPQPVPALPEGAVAISGQELGMSAWNLFLSSKQYSRFLAYNGLADAMGVYWITLEFDDSAEAVWTVGFTDGETWSAPIGLDGVYRVSDSRIGTIGLKGQWMGDSLFRVYLLEKNNSFLQRFDFNFMPGGLDILSYDYTSGQGVTLQGVVMN